MDAWYEQDEFWETVADALFSRKRWADAGTEVERAIELSGVRQGDSILDLCCGLGRHSLELAGRGFRVTGVDRTASYLRRARKRAAADGLAVEFVQDDMRTYRNPEAFDAVINLFTSFGYFEDPEDDRRVLRNIHTSLKEGGSLVMDLMGREVLARIFRERDWYEEESGMLWLEERKITGDWSRVETRWIFIEGRLTKEVRLTLRLYSAREIKTEMLASGFRSVEIYGGLDSSPYDHNARRLIALARK